MRRVIIVVAALMSLGLAAFGVVAAQKAAAPTSATAPAVRVASNTSAVPAPATVNQAAQAQVSAAPVKTAATASPTAIESASATATRVAQSTPAQSTPAQNAPAPNANGAAASAVAAASPSGTGVPTSNIPACDKPGGMGLSRIVEIDTTGGPGFGFEHFKQYDFLREKEIVLTFDDGPWPENTPAVLKALADNCLKATFFEIGEHAMWHPQITKQVIEAGMTVGSHTWSHKDLARNPYASDLDLAKQEIEMGASAVHMAAGVPIAPFFRFPSLQHPPALLAYLGERNIATFSTDIDSFDFKIHKPEQVIKSVMSKLEKRGKGIVLMHDFQRATAEAMPELLRQLKAGGYKIVHLVPRQMLTTLPKYDEMVMQKDKLSSNNTRPENSVVHTIGQYVGSPPPASAIHE
ncbi:MAG TPA: polysaccharide deacetylase family protein [Xanthobacteraceae bacterium]|nr:polysaccharide deacetylase family protein [Xanthobacteraceae bacterium]